MPREGGTSSAFRSFAFCKDPGEVVDHQTVRKPRTTRVRDRAAVGQSRHLHNHNHYHREVSVTQDFLKGAIELEQSLAMLTKLQQDSKNYMLAKPSKISDDVGLGKMNLFNPNNNHSSSSDGLLLKKDHDPFFLEIKKLMRDGRVGSHHHLFDSSIPPPMGEEDEVCFYSGNRSRRVQLVDSSYLPSPSSSQTSFLPSSGFLSPDSSISSTPTKQKQKQKKIGVAKKKQQQQQLASLDNTFFWRGSSSPLNPSRRRSSESDVKQRKPVMFDDDSQAVMDEKKKTLDEMIEAVRLKGLLLNSNTNCSKQRRWCGDNTTSPPPPIVLIKSMRYSCLNLDLPITPKPRDKVSSRLGSSLVLDKSLKQQQSRMAEPGVTKDQVWKGEVCYDRRAKEKASPAKTRPSKEESRYTTVSRGREDIRRDLDPNTTNPGDEEVISHGSNQAAHLNGSQSWRKHGIRNVQKTYKEPVIKDHYYEESDCSLTESSSLTSFEEDEFLDQELSKLVCPNLHIRPATDDDNTQSPLESDDTVSPSTSLEAAATARHAPVTTADHTHLEGAVGEIDRWKAMLFSSTSFIHHTNELFDLQADPERHIADEESEQLHHQHHHPHPDDHFFTSPSLILDCANELLDFYGYLSRERLMRPSSQILRHYHTHHHHPGLKHGSCFASLDQVADQIYKGLDSLRPCRRDYDCPAEADNLPLIVERDMMGNNGVISGVWGVGWTGSVSALDDVEEIASIVDWLILDELVEEIVEDSLVNPSRSLCLESACIQRH